MGRLQLERRPQLCLNMMNEVTKSFNQWENTLIVCCLQTRQIVLHPTFSSAARGWRRGPPPLPFFHPY